MKKFLTFVFCIATITKAHAAVLLLDAPESALSNRQPVVVTISLDQENDAISGVAGDFSFPYDLFDVGGVSLVGSAVPLWVTEPKVSEDTYLDGRTHINFEGIFPGGFSGVRSAYYQGTRPGKLFTVNLIPKNKGKGTLLLDNLTLNSYSEDAHALPVHSVTKDIVVPTLSPKVQQDKKDERQIENTTLTAFLTHDESISHNAWYLMINEQVAPSPTEAIYVAESKSSLPEEIVDRDWRKVDIPYVLYYQDRSRYLHVKVLYTNGDFVLRTLPPVENSTNNNLKVGILMISIGFLLLLYGKLALFKKNHTRKK